MSVFSHALIFLLSAGVIWFLSGILVDAVDTVAKRYNKPGFAVAFFVLGMLTSIGEISVAFNATVQSVPQISAGNLMGASTVLFLLVIPLLAVLGNGVPQTRVLVQSNLILVLVVVLLPALLAIDGVVTRTDGAVCLLVYGALVYRLHKRRPLQQMTADVLERTQKELLHTRRATAVDIGKIIGGAVFIFLAGNLLVDESVFFAKWLGIPLSFIGLLLLSIGTNIPELTIALRCVVSRHKDIAFGDYLGSAAANTLIFGCMSIGSGTFAFAASEAVLTSILLALGVALFFVFARSKGALSRGEGAILLVLYACFLLLQSGNAVRLSREHAPEEALHRGAHEASARAAH